MTPAQAAAALLERRSAKVDLAAYCFPKQLAFIQDHRRFKTACCSRRAGKTRGAAVHLLYTAVTFPGCACLFFTVTRAHAKRIIWDTLKQLNKLFKLRGDENETELTIRFPNGSVIYVSGAKDKSEIAKFLGFPLKLVYGDEAQSFRAYLQELIDESIAPTLLDWAGTMVLMGTPGPVPIGYFYEMTKSDTWSNHHWTLYDNEPLRRQLAALPDGGTTPEQLVADECTRRKLPIDHPSIQRHFFGKWMNDSNSLVFHWNKLLNDIVKTPEATEFVVGVDLGYNDADAIAVLGYDHGAVSLIEEIVTVKQGVTPLAKQLLGIVEKYEPMSIVVDAGGLGKKIVSELIERFELPLKPAKKDEKYTHIELLNDAMRQGTFKARASSQFVQDSFLLEWDRDKSNGDKLIVSDAFHSDICDAVLYAYREAMHWVPAFNDKPPPKRDSEAYIEQRAEQLSRRRQQEEVEDPWAVGFEQSEGF